MSQPNGTIGAPQVIANATKNQRAMGDLKHAAQTAIDTYCLRRLQGSINHTVAIDEIRYPTVSNAEIKFACDRLRGSFLAHIIINGNHIISFARKTDGTEVTHCSVGDIWRYQKVIESILWAGSHDLIDAVVCQIEDAIAA